MLPLKIVVRSLVFGNASTALNHPTLFSHDHPFDDDDNDNDAARSPVDTKGRRKKNHKSTDKKPFLVFLPTRQLVTDTYALANLARSLGIDIRPDPSLSRIVFAAPLLSAPSPFPSSSDSPSTSTLSPPSSNFPPPSTWPSSFSFSFSFSVSSALENGVALPFPSLSLASLSQLRSFVAISKGFFRISLLRPNCLPKMRSLARGSSAEDRHGDWDCCSYSLFSRAGNRRVDTMDGFCMVLAGSGWAFFRTQKEGRANHVADWGRRGSEVYLFRKVDLNRVRVRVGGDECRVRELRLPFLDFGNAPLRILQYVHLMTVCSGIVALERM